MKILLVHNFYQSHLIGGEDIIFRREKKSLEACLGKQNIFEYTVSNDNIRFFKLIFTLWFNFRHYYNIQKIIKKNNIHIVHVHNYFPLLTPAIFKAAKQAGAKVILTLHNFRQVCLSGILYRESKGICHDCVGKKFAWSGVKHGCYRGSRLQSLMAAMAFWWYQWCNFWDYIDEYWVLSKTQAEIVNQYINLDLSNPGFSFNFSSSFNSRSNVANNSSFISTPKSQNSIFIKPNGLGNIIKNNKKNTETAQINQKTARSGFLFVGRLEKAKGIDWLLAAWKAIPDSQILYIIGSGQEETELKLKYNMLSNIIFLGQLSHEAVSNWMVKVKYFIHPGLMYETFGLTLIEAMQQGTPVIGLSIGTRLDFIQDGVNGFLMDKVDYNVFKSTIEKAINLSERNYIKLSAEARKTASQFEMSKIIIKQIKAYYRLCKTE